MIAIFYDRKNKREVTGKLGYKSEECKNTNLRSLS